MPALLWIDDELGDHDPAVLLLRIEGIEIDVARYALDGFKAALTNSYSAIRMHSAVGSGNVIVVEESRQEIMFYCRRIRCARSRLMRAPSKSG